MATTGTLAQMSTYLTTGYWVDTGSSPEYSFNISQTGSQGVIKYSVSANFEDFDGLTADRANLVRDAFKYLENITGIDFQETTDGLALDTIFFSDKYYGAYTTHLTDGGYTRRATINIEDTWYYSSNASNDYVTQTILHEIGHALGLGHQGPYNGTTNAFEFTNDSWQTSIMSYYSQTEGSVFYADDAYLQSMMSVDFLALDALYGPQSYAGHSFGSSQAFTGNTVYGFNTNITAAVDPYLSNLSTNGDENAYTIVDGGGIDTFDFSGWSDNQWIDLYVSDANNTSPTASDIGGLVGNLTLAVGTVIENAYGGSGNDYIFGNMANNILKGNAGNDVLYGDLGRDQLDGGDGDDFLYGEDGNDRMSDVSGANYFNGGDGIDTVSYLKWKGNGVNLNVNLSTGANNANDTYVSIENLMGSSWSSDTLTGTNGANVIWGRLGYDTLYGLDGDDTLYGDGGKDRLYGGDGNDALYGGTQNDFLSDVSGANHFDGGSGTDTVSYLDWKGNGVSLSVDLSTGANNVNDTYVSIENLMGSSWSSDTLTGTNGANIIWGRLGHDTLYGLGGNDTLYGDGGNDYLYGGDGDDLLNDVSGANYFDGGDGIDTVSYLYWKGNGVNLNIDLSTGANNANDTYVSIENLMGSSWSSDTLTGTNGANVIWGRLGHDTLYGLGGDDTLYGDNGNDHLYGGDGDDTLYGGGRADWLEGGAGADVMFAGDDTYQDVFVFKDISESGLTSGTQDRIYEFDSGEDVIDLSAIDANTNLLADQMFSFSTVGATANAVWTVDTGADFVVYGDVDGDALHDFLIKVMGINTLQASDFIL